MPKVAPLDNVIRRLARSRADKVRQAFADNPKNNYRVMKQMEDDLIGELTPMLTKTWKPSMRRGLIGMKDIMESGRFKNQLETGRSGGAYNPDDRWKLSDEYFYGNRSVPRALREKYGYLKRPNEAYGEDDVRFYGDYDIRFKPSVRKRMTVTNGDSYDNWLMSGYVFHGTPIVPDDPETYINWVAAPENFGVNFIGEPKLASEDVFSEVLKDLKTYKRPTVRLDNDNYIEAQYHGPLTLDDVESVRAKDGVPGWLRDAAERYRFKIEE